MPFERQLSSQQKISTSVFKTTFKGRRQQLVLSCGVIQLIGPIIKNSLHFVRNCIFDSSKERKLNQLWCKQVAVMKNCLFQFVNCPFQLSADSSAVANDDEENARGQFENPSIKPLVMQFVQLRTMCGKQKKNWDVKGGRKGAIAPFRIKRIKNYLLID